jgi:hypothetical protein
MLTDFLALSALTDEGTTVVQKVGNYMSSDTGTSPHYVGNIKKATYK